MFMRKGDFIEDKFGQIQRNALKDMKDDHELLFDLFDWFGSYLVIWAPEGDKIDITTPNYNTDIMNNSIMVTHIRGRR